MSTPEVGIEGITVEKNVEATPGVSPVAPSKKTVVIQDSPAPAPDAGNNESNIRSQSEKYNEGTKSKQLIHEEYNSGRNLQTILRLIEEGRARDLDEEPKHEGVPVIIIGSGPSLDEAGPLLHKWHGGIICSPSHAATLMYYGVEPTHVMTLDPFESWASFEGVDWSKTRTKLITHPGVWPDIIENWPNDILLYRQNLGRSDSFYATTQRNMYSTREGDRNKSEFLLHIRTEITVFACSPPCQLFAADRLGYGSPFLVGCDFAFSEEKDRFTEYTVKHEARTVEVGNAAPVAIPTEWEEHLHPNKHENWGDRAQEELVMTNNGLETMQVLLYYKKNMISAWRLMGATVWIVGASSITEMPKISIKRLMLEQDRLPKPRSAQWNIKASERYLASVGAFVIVTEPDAEGRVGHNFIESPDPETQVHGYMVKQHRMFICPVCGVGIEGQDDTDHTGMKCPRCGGGAMQRRFTFDIGKNMTRIRNLLAWVKEHPVEIKAVDGAGAKSQTIVTPKPPTNEA